MVKFNKLVPLAIKYKFTPSCLYDFDDNDEYDKNKLVGLAFVVLPRIRTKSWLNKVINHGGTVLPWFKFLGLVVINPIHWSSARVCWNTVNKEGKIDIWPYIYDKGIRVSGLKKMTMCDIDKPYLFGVNMDKSSNMIQFFCREENKTKPVSVYYKLKDIGIFFLFLDLFFGGNKAAPHDMAFYYSMD